MSAASIADYMNQQKVQAISNEVLHRNDGLLVQWHWEPIGSGERNFVTGGVFRIIGTTAFSAVERISWSFIHKIVKPDPARANPLHFNYWRREVEAYESGLLQRLPANFTTPQCYAIDHQEDGSISLWLEDVGHELHLWDKQAYAFACMKLGELHAAYLLGEPLPHGEWINPQWMRSWIHECKSYRPALNAEMIEQLLSDERLSSIMLSLNKLEDNVGDWITALEQLPRVYSHQDYYEQNILLRKDQRQEDSVMLIDWQFASVSGVGEDLGRFLGLAVSRGQVPVEQFVEYRELFFTSYMEGMREAGWQGDSNLSRFGFVASFAMRAIWEAPKLLRWLEHKREASDTDKLMRIVEYQMEAALEAEKLLSRIQLQT